MKEQRDEGSFLLDESVYFEIWKTKKDHDFEEDVFKAASNGKLSSIIYILANGTNINIEFPNEEYDGMRMKNSTPMFFSARYGHLKVVEYLIDHGANVNAKNSFNETPLHYSALNGHLKITEYLVYCGAYRNEKDCNVCFYYNQ